MEFQLLEIRTYTTPESFKLTPRGYIDNGWISNFASGEATLNYRTLHTQRNEALYVAAKNPDATVTYQQRKMPFIQAVALHPHDRIKPLGKPRSKGGLIDPRPDWEHVCLAVMEYGLVQKFAPGTREHRLLTQSTGPIVEWNNWRDRRWGVVVDPRHPPRQASDRNALGRLLTLIRDQPNQMRMADEATWPTRQVELIDLLNKAA